MRRRRSSTAPSERLAATPTCAERCLGAIPPSTVEEVFEQFLAAGCRVLLFLLRLFRGGAGIARVRGDRLHQILPCRGRAERSILLSRRRTERTTRALARNDGGTE